MEAGDRILEEMGFGPYPVTELAHDVIEMSDRTKLAVKYWLPCDKSSPPETFQSLFRACTMKWMTQLYQSKEKPEDQEKFPVILEYLPYYKDGFTAERDHARHPWFCSHGYVCARLEIRGSGASEGFYYDEYSDQEIEDCLEAINWLSEQSWCNGNIGMYGKSWGGFNGLQVAYKQPRALKTAISLYSTDNRYTDDIHYQGGTIIGSGMLSWASVMFSWNARPPPPKYYDSCSAWKKAWQERLEETSLSWLLTWLSSQNGTDSYWKHGSIDQDYKRIICPILIIGGLADGYTNGALRMAALLNEASRGIVGPWSHDWPDTSPAGPNIDFLGICLSWFDFHLKSFVPSGQGVLGWPRLSMFLRESFHPDQVYGRVPGKFIAIPNWPRFYNNYVDVRRRAGVESSECLNYLYCGLDYVLSNEASVMDIPCVPLLPHALQGALSGLWLTYGYERDLPGDQQLSNMNSSCWLSAVLDKDLAVVGFSTMFLALEATKKGRYVVQVNVCDVAADGSSTLVTRGCLNLSQVNDLVKDCWIADFPANEVKLVPVELKAVGHIFKAGRRVCVSVMPSYFPTMWPAVDSDGLLMHPGKSFLMYQSLSTSDLCRIQVFPPPRPLLKLKSKRLSEACWSLDAKEEDGYHKYHLHDDNGLVVYPSLGLSTQEVRDEVYCTDKCVSCGKAEAKSKILMNFEIGHYYCNSDRIMVVIETHQSMIGNKHRFHVKEFLDVKVDGEPFFSRSWNNVVPRKYV